MLRRVLPAHSPKAAASLTLIWLVRADVRVNPPFKRPALAIFDRDQSSPWAVPPARAQRVAGWLRKRSQLQRGYESAHCAHPDAGPGVTVHYVTRQILSPPWQFQPKKTPNVVFKNREQRSVFIELLIRAKCRQTHSGCSCQKSFPGVMEILCCSVNMSLEGNRFEKKPIPLSVLVLSHPVTGHVKIKDI